METTVPAVAARQRAFRPSALALIVAGATAGIGLVLIAVMLILSLGFDPGFSGIAAVCLVIALVIAAGWRWTPVLALLPGIALPAMLAPVLLTSVGSPLFLSGLLLLAFGTIAVVGGIGATVQNYLRPVGARPLPRWAPLLIALLLGAVGGAEALARSPQPAPAAGVSAEMLATLPVLTGQAFEFSQAEIRVRAGETVALRLENTDPEYHQFDIDELGVHAPMPVGQTGVALFRPTEPGVYTFYCAPHYDKASGEGMKGTLIVE